MDRANRGKNIEKIYSIDEKESRIIGNVIMGKQ